MPPTTELLKLVDLAREIVHTSYPKNIGACEIFIHGAAQLCGTQIAAVHNEVIDGRQVFLVRDLLPGFLEGQLEPDPTFPVPDPIVQWMRIVRTYQKPNCSMKERTSLQPVFRIGKRRVFRSGPFNRKLLAEVKAFTPPIDWCIISPAAVLPVETYKETSKAVLRFFHPTGRIGAAGSLQPNR